DEVGDLHVLHTGPSTHVASAAAVESGDGDADGVVGAEHAAGGLGAGDGYQGADARGLEEVTASRERHGGGSFVLASARRADWPLPYHGGAGGAKKKRPFGHVLRASAVVAPSPQLHLRWLDDEL